MQRKKLPPVPPGEVLLEEFLKPLGVSQYQLAKAMSVPPRRINEIVHGKRAITADTALRLSAVFDHQIRYAPAAPHGLHPPAPAWLAHAPLDHAAGCEPVQGLLLWYWLAYGWSPEEIHSQHPDLSLAQIHAALAYYYDHQAELDAAIASQEDAVRRLRKEAGDSPLVTRLKARGLLS